MRRILPLLGLMLLCACTPPPSWTLQRSGTSSSLPPMPPTVDSGAVTQQGLLVEVEEESSTPTGSDATAEFKGDDGSLMLGDARAPITMTFVTNPACAYCRTAWTEMMPRLRDDVLSTGRMNVRVAILPLNKYPSSLLEAAVLSCATERGQGMKAYDVLQSLTVRDRTSTTKALKSAGLDANALMACADRTATKKVVSQLASTLSGVTLIPSFVFQDGEHMTGLPTYPELRGWVEAHISNR